MFFVVQITSRLVWVQCITSWKGYSQHSRLNGQEIDAIPPLGDQIFTKYPLFITQQVYGQTVPTISEFQNTMANYINMRVSIQAAIDATGIYSKPRIDWPHSTTANLVVTRNKQSKYGTHYDNKSKPIPICTLCDKKHYSADCQNITTLSDCRQAATNRCYLCLNKNHSMKECTRIITCPICAAKQKHHRSLCPLLFDNDQNKVSS